MTTYVENKLINLNSDNAMKLNGDYNSSVYFQFTGLLNDDPSVRNINVAVQNAQFPYSFYNVNVYNNTLSISVNSNPTVILTFTRGNYNATTLITEIQTQLNIKGITDIAVTISSITGLLTFTKASGSFTLYKNGSTCFKLLGFGNQDYTSVGGVILAPYPLNLLGTLKMRIASNKLSINNIDSSVQGALNILASIAINAGNFGLIMYDNTTMIMNQLNLRVLDGFDLEILDDDNNLINFNNTYWTITLLLQIEREVVPVQNTQGLRQLTTTFQKLEPNVDGGKEIQEGEVQDGNVELYTEPPDLEETIVADDLDLLLYSHGVR